MLRGNGRVTTLIAVFRFWASIRNLQKTKDCMLPQNQPFPFLSLIVK